MKERSGARLLGARLLSVLYPIAALAGLGLVWHVGVIAFEPPAYLIPSPVDVIAELVNRRAFLLENAWVTTYETIGGFLLSIVIGIPLAVLIVWSGAIEKAVMPFLVLSQTFPKVAIAPLLIIWFGFGVFTKILVSFLVAFFPVVISAITGMRSVENDMIELARSMQASTFQIFWRIRLPYALPSIFGGLKVAMAFAIVGAVVGEWVGANVGLGHVLLWANANLETPVLFAVLLLLMIIGVILYYSVVAIEQLVVPWHVSMRGDLLQPTM